MPPHVGDEHHQDEGEYDSAPDDCVAEASQPCMLGVSGLEPHLHRLHEPFPRGGILGFRILELEGGVAAWIVPVECDLDTCYRLRDLRGHLDVVVQRCHQDLRRVEVLVSGLDQGAAPPVAGRAGSQRDAHRGVPRSRQTRLGFIGEHGPARNEVAISANGHQLRLQPVRSHQHILRPDAARRTVCCSLSLHGEQTTALHEFRHDLAPINLGLSERNVVSRPRDMNRTGILTRRYRLCRSTLAHASGMRRTTTTGDVASSTLSLSHRA